MDKDDVGEMAARHLQLEMEDLLSLLPAEKRVCSECGTPGDTDNILYPMGGSLVTGVAPDYVICDECNQPDPDEADDIIDTGEKKGNA